MEEHNKNINRRDFLKIVGISAATTTAAATLYSCKQKDGVIPGGSASTPVPTDKMTYRTSVAQKDRVSLRVMAVCVGRLFLHRMGKEI